jgi:hypothetical protein
VRRYLINGECIPQLIQKRYSVIYDIQRTINDSYMHLPAVTKECAHKVPVVLIGTIRQVQGSCVTRVYAIVSPDSRDKKMRIGLLQKVVIMGGEI